MSRAMSLGARLYERHRDPDERPPVITLFDREWDLLPGVFAPMFTRATTLLTQWLPYPPGGSFLEVGSGAGVTAVMAALRGCAPVTAVDINPAAVENTRRNAERHGVSSRVRVVQSDLFRALSREERYDLIFWNSNFIEAPEDYEHDSELARSFFDPGYHDHARYVDEGPRYLTERGRIFLGFSDLGELAALERLAASAHRRVVVCRRLQPPGSAWEHQLVEIVPEVRGGSDVTAA